MKTVFFTRFEATVNGGGGVRRFSQINDALFPVMDYTIETTRQNIKAWSVDAKWYGLKYQWLKFRYPIFNYWKEQYQDYTENNFHYAAEWVERYRNKMSDFDFVLVDDPVYFAPLVDKIANNTKLPIIAFIHNIESLSVEQVREDRVSELLQYELSLLKKCSLCVTISREETFLLENFGINVFYLPYYPPVSIENRMKAVREKRKSRQKKNVLFVGTVNNIPTGNGLIALITAWKEHHLSKTGHTLLIAGYGTQDYRSYAEGVEGIDFLGPVDDKTLDGLLAEILCTVIYQATGSGALTKISEMLIAGIPMLANTHAIRSYDNIDGIFEFSKFEQISELLDIEQLENVEIAIPNQPDTQRMIDIIHESMVI